MAIPTRAGIERDIVQRWGKHLARCGRDISAAGANLDLNAPIRDALGVVGVDTADPLSVADADLALLAGPRMTRFFVVAELRVVDLLIAQWGEAYLATERDLNVTPEERVKVLDRMYLALKTRKAELEDEARRPLRIQHRPSIGVIARGTFVPNGRTPCSYPGDPYLS